MASATNEFRGLTNFIKDTRAAKSKEDQSAIVNAEIVKIRQKFNTKTLDSYNTRKYLCKLMYCFLLGHDVDFGLLEACTLLGSDSKLDKTIGHTFLSVMLSDESAFTDLLTASLLRDLESGDTVYGLLAANTIANIGNSAMADSIVPTLLRIILDGTVKSNGEEKAVRTLVRKKAIIALIRLYRKTPENIIITDDILVRFVALLEERNVGFLLAAVTFLYELSLGDYVSNPILVSSRSKALYLLGKIRRSEVSENHMYGGQAAPWLQVKLLQFIQRLPVPNVEQDPEDHDQLMKTISAIFIHYDVNKPDNLARIMMSVLYEAVILAVNANMPLVYFVGVQDEGQELPQILSPTYFNQIKQQANRARSLSQTKRAENRRRALSNPNTCLLSKLIRTVEIGSPNLRYVALRCLERLGRMPEIVPYIQRYNRLFAECAKQLDTSVAHVSLNVLYRCTDESSAEENVGYLLELLTPDSPVFSELVLLIAVLSQKYLSDRSNFIMASIKLIKMAGSEVPEIVVDRLIHTIVSQGAPGDEVVKICLEAINVDTPQPAMIKLASYIVSFAESSAEERCLPLVMALKNSKSATQYILTALARIYFQTDENDEVRPKIVDVISLYANDDNAIIHMLAQHLLQVIQLNKPQALSYVPISNSSHLESSLQRRLGVADIVESTDIQADIPLPEHKLAANVSCPSMANMVLTKSKLYEDEHIQLGLMYTPSDVSRTISYTIYVGNKTSIPLEISLENFSPNVEVVSSPKSYPVSSQQKISLLWKFSGDTPSFRLVTQFHELNISLPSFFTPLLKTMPAPVISSMSESWVNVLSACQDRATAKLAVSMSKDDLRSILLPVANLTDMPTTNENQIVLLGAFMPLDGTPVLTISLFEVEDDHIKLLVVAKETGLASAMLQQYIKLIEQ